MNLADHLRPLLRDHDCVIIPDFGGLVAEYTPAQVRPGGRHLLVPPTRQVAFNQALTRNDGLLVDALRQHLGLPAAEAREAVRQAVALLHHELLQQQRTELPGIGVFRQLPARGLQFDYTGTDNLLPTAFGLPELAAHPVRVLDARLAREQQTQLLPRLRAVGSQGRWRRLVPGAAIGLLAGVAVAAFYLLSLHPEAAPVAWRGHLPHFEAPIASAAPQQAALTPVSIAAQPVPAQLVLAKPVLTQPVPAQLAPAPTQTAPGQVVAGPMARATPNAAEVLLDAPATGVRPGKAAKVPASGAVALANESNIARPVPLLKRHAAEPGLTTAYPVTPPSAIKPILGPVLLPSTATRPSAATARPMAAAKRVATPVVKPAALAAKPAAPVTKPVVLAATPVAAAKSAAPVAKAVAIVAKPVVATKPAVVVAASVPATAVLPATALPAAGATTIKQRTGRFYVIVAAYTSLARAEVGRQNLAHAGRSAKVITPPLGSRLYRLSAADFADRPTATLAAARLRQNPHFDKGLTILPY
ncbi:MAG: hypothetical protein EOO59_09890 [Hymenobacter sp.]|nr:MAG: hypothetical protein EOO59_09890 [Hymenobacter sp.]